MMIAIAVFSVVIGVSLQQFNDCVNVSTYATVQADLRRIGQDVLAKIAQDLRSTMSVYVGTYSQSGTINGNPCLGDTLELTRVKAFNYTTQNVILETNSSAQRLYMRYASPSSALTPDGRYQILKFWHGNQSFLDGSTPTSELSRELAPNGFQIIAADASTPFTVHSGGYGNYTNGTVVANPFPPASNINTSAPTCYGVALTGDFYEDGRHYLDEPVLMAIRLTMRRRIGFSLATGEIFTVVNMQTEIQLRPSQNY